MNKLHSVSYTNESSDRFIGRSDSIKKLKELIRIVAPLESTVLITGESGTGKELVADMIHSQGNRWKGPFVKINCAAIPENLLESELFGVEKGAFTGADVQRPGKFELADNGTILLDEIGEMPLSVQAKLLRVVEQKKVDKLGGRASFSVDARIIASTNQDLANQIRNKMFRQDLYYRLNVVSVYIPPLRERPEDILSLAEYFLGKISCEMKLCFENVTDEAMEILMSYDWPGNARELANLLERAAIFCKSSIIDEVDIRRAFQYSYRRPLSDQIHYDKISLEKEGGSLPEVLVNVEKNLILRALFKTKGVQAEAAKILGLSSKNLWKKIQKHSIDLSLLHSR